MKLEPGNFYFCDIEDGLPGFVLLLAVEGFEATCIPFGYGQERHTRKVHADCLSRTHFGRVKPRENA